jgi:hypothetical protein
MKNVLILNSDMSPIIMPITVLGYEQAIRRVLSGNCFVVLSYDIPIQTPNPKQLDRYGLRNWPSVIARKDYLKSSFTVALTPGNLFIRDCGICQYCGQKVSKESATKEHYIPQCKGGKTNWENILLACADCNSRKGDNDPVEKWKPLKIPTQPGYWEIVNKKLEMPIIIDDINWLQFLPKWKGEVIVRS